MYNHPVQYPSLPYIQPLYYYRVDRQNQGYSYQEQPQLQNYQVPIMIQQNNEQHRIFNDTYTCTSQPFVNCQAINTAGECPQIVMFGNMNQSPSMTAETRRLTNHSFEQLLSSSTFDKNNKKQHTEQCEELSIIDFPQIHSNKNKISNIQPISPVKKETFSEDYRVARYRKLQTGQNNSLKIVFNQSEQQLNTSQSMYIKNEELENEANMRQQQINSSYSSTFIKKEIQGSLLDLQSISSVTNKSKKRELKILQKQHRNSQEIMQLENNVDNNTLLIMTNIQKGEFKNKQNPKLNQFESESQRQIIKQLSDSNNFVINKDSTTCIEENLSTFKQQKQNKFPLNFVTNVPDQKTSRKIQKKVINSSKSDSIQENFDNKSQSSEEKESFSVIDQIKNNLAQEQSVQAAIDEIQQKKDEFSHLETLSKCIYIMQQSETHKYISQILKQPFFLTSDLQNQKTNHNQTLKSVSQPIKNFNEQLNSSSQKQFKSDQPQQQNFSNNQGNKQVNNLTVSNLQNQSSIIGNQTIQNNILSSPQSDEKQQLNLPSQQQTSNYPTKILDYQESIKKRLLFQPRDTRMLNLYNFSVMRDFPERRNSNPNNNSKQNSIVDMQNENDTNQLDRMDEEDIDFDPNQQQSKQIKKQKKKTLYSRFHNLNKLFIYNIMAMLQSENLENFSIPQYLRVELIQFLKKLKLSGKIRPCFDDPNATETFAVESFSHVHYNVLFLKISESNLSIIRKSPRDIFLHKLCFNVDLNNCLEIEIMKINILKKIIFQIFIQSIQEHLYVDDHTFSKSNNRVLYTIKAIRGIKKLSLGIYFNRF